MEGIKMFNAEDINKMKDGDMNGMFGDKAPKAKKSRKYAHTPYMARPREKR